MLHTAFHAECFLCDVFAGAACSGDELMDRVVFHSAVPTTKGPRRSSAPSLVSISVFLY